MGGQISGGMSSSFRYSAVKGYLPKIEEVTALPLFNEYFFELELPTSEKICQTELAIADFKNEKGEMEKYCSLALFSSEDGKNRRKLTNMVIVCDISGSMRYSIDYDYSREKGITKLDLCLDAVNNIISTLKPNERLGIVLFDHNVQVFQEIKKVSDIKVDELKERVKNIKEKGGTYLEGAFETAVSMLKGLKGKDEASHSNQNRIVFLTDGKPNDKSEEKNLSVLVKDAAKMGFFVTFIGVGVDFNAPMINSISKTRGCNYFSIHDNEQFSKILKDDFNYYITPICFDLKMTFMSEGFQLEKVYGTPSDDDFTGGNSGELLTIDTLLASPINKRGMKGGVILLKLKELSSDKSNIRVVLNFSNVKGEKFTEIAEIDFNAKMKEMKMEKKKEICYQNLGIRKSILLAKYNDFLRKVIGSALKTTPVKKDSHCEAIFKGCIFNIPLKVKQEISQFKSFFEEEMNVLGDKDLTKEIEVLQNFTDKEFISKKEKEVEKSPIEDQLISGKEDPSKWYFNEVPGNNKGSSLGIPSKEKVLAALYHCDPKCNKAIPPLLEICFSFDVTGSMAKYIVEVRKQLKSLVKTLLQDLPSIRISIIAHSDYCDAPGYVMKKLDLTNHLPTLVQFIEVCHNGGGGDIDENYEQVLMESQTLSWSKESKAKCLVVIGDADPHRKTQYFGIDWEREVEKCNAMGIKCFGVQCGESSSLDFYNEISKRSGGQRLVLKDLRDIIDIFLGLCYRESSCISLRKFEKEIHDIKFVHDNKSNIKYYMNTEKTGKIDFLRVEEMNRIHERLHSSEKIKKVMIKERRFNIARGRAGCRYVRIKDLMFVQQSTKNLNDVEAEIMKGKSLTWINVGGIFGYYVTPKIVEQ